MSKLFKTRITSAVLLIVLILFCFPGIPLRAADASDTDWQTVYEGGLTSASVFNDWIPVAGDWTLTTEGLKKSGKATDGLLMLRMPVVKGAVRIEYEAKADSQPDDLSLYLGMKDGDFAAAALVGFGSKGNTTNTLRVPGMPESPGKGRSFSRSQIDELPPGAVKIDDKFWSPKQKIYRENTLRGAWPHLATPLATLASAATPEKQPVKEHTLWIEANVHKILEAAAWALLQEPDAELERQVNETIALIAAAQQPDGYIDARVINEGLPHWDMNSHDGFTTGHLMEAAVAHYRANGRKDLLDVACRAADCAWRHFVEQKSPGFPGHSEIEPALGELYRLTGNRKYLDLLQTLIEARGQKSPPGNEYFQDHAPIRQQNDIRGHAVKALYFAQGVADLGMESGDTEYCDAARRLWNSSTRKKMYVTGGVGSRPANESFGDDYELPNRTAYCESCANCGMVNFAHRMLRMDGHAEAADIMELALYNAALHGMSLDGKTIYAYATPLSDFNHPRFVDWLCCASSLTRTLLQVARYVYAVSDDCIYVNLFVSGECRAPLKDGPVMVRVETEYPWSGAVEIRIEPEQPQAFALRIRIPGWSRGATLSLNGEKIEQPTIEKGYAVIRRTWQPGDTVQLDLPMPVVRLEAHPDVLENRGKITIQRGPMVYGLESLDNDGRALVMLPPDPHFQTEHCPDLLGGVTVVRGRTSDNRPFLAIPFYALANRGLAMQEVWQYQEGKGEPKEGWKDKLYREFVP